jgi:hypothetical protein
VIAARVSFPVVLAALALIYAAPAAPSSGVRFGIQDDAWIAHGPGTLADRLATLDGLGVDLVRFSIRWDDVARRAPGEAENPDDAAYDWRLPDAVLNGLRDRGIAAVVTLVGTPRWANGNRLPAYAPGSPSSFGAFAFAAASRYAWVRDWTIWNEPNLRRWLVPTTPAVYVRRLLNPAYGAIHRANPRARVGGGVTAPRANVGGVSPVAWIRGMRAAGARLDAYAHHPYPAGRFETPFAGGCRGQACETITMANLELLLAEVRRSFGAKRIWLTEYGYQTNPPDVLLGVSEAKQARYLGEASLRAYRAPAVDMLIHYLYQDETAPDRFQSGLVNARGLSKIAAAAFPFPLAQTGRVGAFAQLWGQVRPRSGPQPYRLELISGNRRSWLGGTRTTRPGGFFTASVHARKGSLIRIWSPRDGLYSATIAVR